MVAWVAGNGGWSVYFASAAGLQPYCGSMTQFMLRVLALLLVPALGFTQPVVNIGSKRFTESYILGEIMARTVEAAGEARAQHHQGLGNTAILYSALKSGAIHAYPEYTGTIALELLGLQHVPDLVELDRLLAPHGLAAAVPFGFGNSYALAMRATRAQELGITRLSDLARHPGLKLALSQEFLNRRDGWPALRAAYRFAFTDVRGLDHGLAYEALAVGQVDVVDAYTTDAKIPRYGLRVLEDDLRFFPAYDALILYRRDFAQQFPRSWEALRDLAGRIGVERMIELNAAVELRGSSFTEAASAFLETSPGGAAQAGAGQRSFLAALTAPDLWRLTLEHLVLVAASLALGVAIGVPLGVCADRAPRARHWILGAAGVLQTIPSLALLAFLIAALDRIGTLPAIVALFLYSLLPIVRNTESGLAGVSATLRQSAIALGMSDWLRLRLIELPLAARTILAGIKIAAVINVGTATIAAFIGAGGYGERIVAGLAVNDHAMLLAGAVPAAVMALAVQWLFDFLERRFFWMDGPPGPGARRS
ncbi:MAG TPA: glycine betaine ABC transporter substrate-binding protein [Burkholderiales bacterium]|nr:glycine betaine ABC transporter substrate-binding protein [Burkholderiales bacterium]